MAVTYEDIKDYLKEDTDEKKVKSILDTGNKITTDEAEEFVKTKEGEKFLEPHVTSRFDKGSHSWKKKNLQPLIDTEVEKDYKLAPELKAMVKSLRKSLKQSLRETRRKLISVGVVCGAAGFACGIVFGRRFSH